ncbi:MAG: GIY-YIG nuclease family protein [Patescibacteria group bacterium]|nr:GIY-YIG nuclease family protein [Patescibacteria group bacterium]
MYWVYVLENQNDKGWYIGYTINLEKRLREHQSGYGSRTTSARNNWEMIYYEGYKNQLDAKGRERFLKSGSGRKFLKKQLKNYLGVE